MFKTTLISKLSIVLLIGMLVSCSSERNRFAAGVYHTQKKKTQATAIRQKEKNQDKAADAAPVKEADPLIPAIAVADKLPEKALTEPEAAAKKQAGTKISGKNRSAVPLVSSGQARQVLKDLKQEYKPESKAEAKNAEATKGKDRSWLTALLLCFFLGAIGIHRFYLGYIWQGIVQVLTLGCCGVWTLIDFIRIITKDLVPKGGDYTD